MALGIYRPEGPPIWRRRRGEAIFSAPNLVEVFDGATWKASEAARLKISGRWEDGSDTDASWISGRWRAGFPLPSGSHLVLYGRARGDLRGLKIITPAGSVPVTAYWLGLDAHTTDQTPPRGWHPWAARAPNRSTVELQAPGALRVSLLLARFVTDTGDI